MNVSLSSPKQRCRGAALILAVLFLVFVAIFLASYLFMTESEYATVARSQSWNASMVLAEAGVEDALALLNKNVGQIGNVTNWSSSATADGWSLLTANSSYQVFYLASRSPDPNLGYYSVYITNFLTGTSNGPSILAIGTAYWNTNNGPQTDGSNVVVSYHGNTVRKVLVQTLPMTQAAGGMIALSTMNFVGNNVAIDSFNSADPNHSIWQTAQTYHGMHYGLWNSSLSFNTNIIPSRTANVYVATDGNIINVGNANIAGYVDTAPGGTAAVGSKGSVGDLNWSMVLQTSGIQPGHSKDDMNETFHSLDLPTPTNSITGQTTWWPVPSPTNVITIGGWYTNGVRLGGIRYTNFGSGYNIGGTTYSLVITNRPATNYVYYAMNQLTASIFVDAQNVVLYLTNGMSYSGNGTFTLNTNADVQVWSTGNITTSGNGVINNGTQYTHAFSIYDVAGHPINISLGGNGAGTGYIYAPSASLSFSGGGSDTYDVVGAIFCHDISINGHYNFHFDESLQTQLPTDQYTLSSWQEVQ